MDNNKNKINNSKNVNSIISFISGILGLLFGIIPVLGWLFMPLWIVAIVCGVVGREKQNQKKLATIGLVLGIITVVYKIGFWIWTIVVIPILT